MVTVWAYMLATGKDDSRLTMRITFTNAAREHTMVGFKDGEPEAVWFSQYGKGVAYSYDSLDKYGLRVSRLPLVAIRQLTQG